MVDFFPVEHFKFDLLYHRVYYKAMKSMKSILRFLLIAICIYDIEYVLAEDEPVEPCEIGEPLRCPETGNLFNCDQCPEAYNCTFNKYCCLKDQYSIENLKGICKMGWSNFGKNCYIYQYSADTWYNARDRCKKWGGFLTDVYNEEENMYISGLAMDDIWIGGTVNHEENRWYWQNGNKVKFSEWERGEPNNHGSEDCLEMLVNQYEWNLSYKSFKTTPGNWNDAKCLAKHPFVCKYSLEGIEEKEETTTQSTDNYNFSGDENEFITKENEFITKEPKCKEGWIEYENNCYFYHKHSKIWVDAKDYCENQESNLVDIKSIEENTFVRDNTLEDIWLGGNDRENEGHWVWTNGNEVTFENWEKHEPNNEYNENCMGMLKFSHHWYHPNGSWHTRAGSWNDDRCNGYKPFMCKYNPNFETNIIEPDLNIDLFEEETDAIIPFIDNTLNSKKCESGWLSYKNSCYNFVEKNNDWISAVEFCKDYNSNLVYITSKEENAFILEHITDNIWLGASDKAKEGAWIWETGNKMKFTNWENGEPNNYYDEDCLAMLKHSYFWMSLTLGGWHTTPGKWLDDDCDKRKPFVCKYSSESTNDEFSGNESTNDEYSGSGIGDDEDYIEYSGNTERFTDEVTTTRSFSVLTENFFLEYTEEVTTEVSKFPTRAHPPHVYTEEDEKNTNEINKFPTVTHPIHDYACSFGEPLKDFEKNEIFFCSENSLCPEYYDCSEIAENSLGICCPKHIEIDIQCQEGWHNFQDACYKIEDTNLSHTDAVHYCNNQMSEIADIHSDEEKEFLIKLTKESESEYWVNYVLNHERCQTLTNPSSNCAKLNKVICKYYVKSLDNETIDKILSI